MHIFLCCSNLAKWVIYSSAWLIRLSIQLEVTGLHLEIILKLDGTCGNADHLHTSLGQQLVFRHHRHINSRVQYRFKLFLFKASALVAAEVATVML